LRQVGIAASDFLRHGGDHVRPGARITGRTIVAETASASTTAT
jgi:hypothetical protein